MKTDVAKERKAEYQREYDRKRYAADPEKNRERARRWHAANPEQGRERVRKWRDANPEKYLERNRKWHAANPGKQRQYVLKRKYGMTPAQVQGLLDHQGNCCAICRTDTPGGRGDWHVDHDHVTNVVRGLLCTQCNVALGLFADDPTRLAAAIAYLLSK